MSESSNAGRHEREPGDHRWETFTVRELAYEVREALEALNDDETVTQRRLIRLEEVAAARWPRRWLLRARLGRELRASVAGYTDDHIPHGDFYGRRLQFVSELVTVAHVERLRRLEDRERHRAGGEPGDADPGEGFLS